MAMDRVWGLILVLAVLDGRELIAAPTTVVTLEGVKTAEVAPETRAVHVVVLQVGAAIIAVKIIVTM